MPVVGLLDSSSHVTDGSAADQLVGSVPERLLFCRSSCWRRGKELGCVQLTGIVPVRLLFSRWRTVKLGSAPLPPKAAGRLPCRGQLLMLSTCSARSVTWMLGCKVQGKSWMTVSEMRDSQAKVHVELVQACQVDLC